MRIREAREVRGRAHEENLFPFACKARHPLGKRFREVRSRGVRHQVGLDEGQKRAKENAVDVLRRDGRNRDGRLVKADARFEESARDAFGFKEKLSEALWDALGFARRAARKERAEDGFIRKHAEERHRRF